MSANTSAQRGLWRGSTPEQRKDERRERLLAEALEIFGTTGYHSSTVSGICSAAGVSTRTFYELFDQRADVIEALYARVVDQIRADIEALPPPTIPGIERWARNAVDAVVGPLLADLRVCRVVEIEIVGLSPQIEARRRRANLAIAQTLDSVQQALAADDRPSRAEREFVGVFVVGGITETLVAHMRTPPSERRSADELLDALTVIIVKILMS